MTGFNGTQGFGGGVAITWQLTDQYGAYLSQQGIIPLEGSDNPMQGLTCMASNC